MISFLQMSFCAAALTALICIVRAVLGSRLPKRTFRVLWAVVILRMLVPLSLPVMKINTGISVPSAAEAAAVRDTVVYTYVNGEFFQEGTSDNVTSGIVYEGAEAASGSLSAGGIWLLTAAAVFAVFAAAHVKFRLKVREAIPAEINFEAGIKRQVRIKVSDRIASPLTYGIFYPVILLPKNIYNCDKKTSEYILSHELTHIKRFDVLYKLFMVIAVSLHWFNPFAWVMLVLASCDIELSCDEEVVLQKNGSGMEREEYALTLIEMEEKRSFGVLQNGFGGSSVRERIRSVMRLKRASPAGKAAAALLVAMAFAVFAVYDIDSGVSYSVAVSASEAAEVSYAGTAEEGTVYTEYIIESFADIPFTIEETDYALNSADIIIEEAQISAIETENAAEYADAPVSEATDIFEYAGEPLLETVSAGTYGEPETTVTKMYIIATADGTVMREYSEDYSLYVFGYDDPKTGKAATIIADMNEYAPVDYEQYGFTVSKDKGYFLYGGVPVGGFQSSVFTFVDGNAVRDGGIFLIYNNDDSGRFDETAETDMIRVEPEQFCDITGAIL